jgi:hypothetical protein
LRALGLRSEEIFALGSRRVYKGAQPGGQDENFRIDKWKHAFQRLNLRADF